MPGINADCLVIVLNQGGIEHGIWVARELRQLGYPVQELTGAAEPDLPYRAASAFGHASRILLPVSIVDHLWCANNRIGLRAAGIGFVVDETERIATFANKVSCYRMIEALGLLDSENYPAFRLISGVETIADVRKLVDLPNFWIKGRDKERFPPLLEWLPQPSDAARLFNPKYEYLVQEHVEGPIHGYFALAKDGELYEEFMHRRLRDIPLAGGSCCYAESYDDETLRRIGRDFLRRSRWTGFVMLEFKRDDKGGDYRLIEVNPKLWGTYALSSLSGCRFAKRYVELATGAAHRSQGTRYRPGVRVYYPLREATLADPAHSAMNRLRNIIASSHAADFNVHGDKTVGWGMLGIAMTGLRKLVARMLR